MTTVNTVIDNNCKSVCGNYTHTEIVFADGDGDHLGVTLHPTLRKVYFHCNEQCVSLDEDQIQTLMIEAAKFFREGQRND